MLLYPTPGVSPMTRLEFDDCKFSFGFMLQTEQMQDHREPLHATMCSFGIVTEPM